MSKWLLCMWHHINTYYRMEEFISFDTIFSPLNSYVTIEGEKKLKTAVFSFWLDIQLQENKFPYWVCFARILLINSRDYIHETVLNCVWRMTIWGFRSRYLLFFCATVTSFFSIQLATLRHSCYHGFSAPLEYNVFGSWDQISYLYGHCIYRTLWWPPLPSSSHLWDSLFQMYTIKQQINIVPMATWPSRYYGNRCSVIQ